LKHILVPAALFTLFFLTTCGTTGGSRDYGAPGQPLRELATVDDINPAADVVEFELVAAPSSYEFHKGEPTTLWTYNGQFPGPLIEATVGDEIVVHFTNNLPESTTIHWHGLRLPQAMDGSHASQEPIPPGGSFEYRFRVPDAGLFWYHPHHNADLQLPLGLYGGLLVRAADEPRFSAERVIVLSDALLDTQGRIDDRTDGPFDSFDHALGVEGNLLLANGLSRPLATLDTGARERWRVVNAASTRYFNLAIEGGTLTLIGVDGGLIDQPVQVDSFLLTPGERAEFVVEVTSDSARLINLPYRRLADPQWSTLTGTLVDIVRSGRHVQSPHIVAAPSTAERLPEPQAQRHIQFQALVTDGSGHEPAPGHGSHGDGPSGTFFINAASFPDVPRFETRLGQTELWTVNNHTEMDHPFHMHGFRFQVLDVGGVPPPYRGWKDTVNIPHDELGLTSARLLVRYDGFPGRWVYHCHILHHQEHGMMAEFDVLE
jgi:FtsP/CotA-like multicopper oxidase with cupredoxin domain